MNRDTLPSLPDPATVIDMWNYVTYMFSFPFMVHALEAGTIVAIVAPLVGWFMVLRKQTFAGHTVAMVGFPGAAGAALLNAPITLGYFAFCAIAAFAIGALRTTEAPDNAHSSAVTGTIQGLALGLGFLFISLYHGLATSIDALLFGTYLGITTGQVVTLAAVALSILVLLALLGRRLLFSSLDPRVAAARSVHTFAMSLAFMALLAFTVAEAVQITGVLLVFALLVMPAATAQALSIRPHTSLVLAVAIGLFATWLGLSFAFYTNLPVGFWITTISFTCYLAARLFARRERPRSLHLRAVVLEVE